MAEAEDIPPIVVEGEEDAVVDVLPLADTTTEKAEDDDADDSDDDKRGARKRGAKADDSGDEADEADRAKRTKRAERFGVPDDPAAAADGDAASVPTAAAAAAAAEAPPAAPVVKDIFAHLQAKYEIDESLPWSERKRLIVMEKTRKGGAGWMGDQVSEGIY